MSSPDGSSTRANDTPLTPPQRVVVVGGNGTVGLGVLEALITSGSNAGGSSGASEFAVHAICRRGGPPRGLPQAAVQDWLQRVTWHACDVQDTPALTRCLAAIEPQAGIIAMGRLQPVNQLLPGRRAAVLRDASEPALCAIEALSAAGATALVYVSGLFPEPPPAPPGIVRRGLDLWLQPQQRAKAAVEARVQAQFGPAASLIIRAGLVCGWNALCGVRIWTPPGTRDPARQRWLRRLVPHAVSAVDIGSACVAFLRGGQSGGIIAGAAILDAGAPDAAPHEPQP